MIPGLHRGMIVACERSCVWTPGSTSWIGAAQMEGNPGLNAIGHMGGAARWTLLQARPNLPGVLAGKNRRFAGRWPSLDADVPSWDGGCALRQSIPANGIGRRLARAWIAA